MESMLKLNSLATPKRPRLTISYLQHGKGKYSHKKRKTPTTNPSTATKTSLRVITTHLSRSRCSRTRTNSKRSSKKKGDDYAASLLNAKKEADKQEFITKYFGKDFKDHFAINKY